MYKLREERLRNFYSTDSSTDIQRTQSTPGLHDKPTKEGNGPTHADSLADHSFLSLKSKEIRDSESPTREMHFRVDKTRGGDQGWNVVTKNESSPDGKTHSTSRVATTSGTEKIDGGEANYAAKCEQKASVYNDGDDKNFTKSMATSSRNVIQQEAKGGDDNSNFQSFATSSSSSSNVVSQHRSTTGDTTDFKALPSNVDDSSTATVIRKTYTTDVPAELRNNPNYIDANTKVTTETRTLPDGSRVTTTRYETKGAKTVSTSSSDNHATSSKQVSEQKSSTIKSSSCKTESQSSNRTVQDSRNVHDDVNRNQTHSTQIVRQVPVTQIIRQVPVNYDDTDRTASVQVIRSTNEDVNQNVSQSVSKTSSSSVNIQKSHKVIDSKNVDVNIESNRIVQTKDIRDIRNDAVKQIQDVERNVDVRQEFITSKDNVVKTHTSQGVHGAHQDDVRTIRVIQENEYLPRERQPDFGRTQKDNRTTSTTVRQEFVTAKDNVVKTHTSQDVRGTHQDDLRTIRVIQEKEYLPREKQPDFGYTPTDDRTTSTTVRQEVVTTRDGTVKKTTTEDVRENTQDDARIVKTVQERYPPRDTHPVVDRIPNDQQTSTTVVRKEVITRDGTTQNIRDTSQDDVRVTRIIQENEYLPRDTQPDFGRKPIDQQPSGGHHKTVTTRKEVTTTNKTENIPITTQDDVRITRIIQENEYLPRGKQPGDRTSVPSTPGDRTPAIGTPGDRTPVGRTPGDRTPAPQDIVCHLVPQHERPGQHIPKGQQPSETRESYTTKTATTTVSTNVDNKTSDKKVVTDDFINKERTHVIDTRRDQREPSPKYEKPKSGQKEPSPKYETPEKREPIRPGKSELDEKPTPTDGQYQTTYRTDYVNKRISVDVSPTHDAFARSLRAISPDRDKKRGSTRSLKSSTSSLRSSTSPEKYPTDRRQPGRVSPDRKPRPDSRGTSPVKSPDSKICYPTRSPTRQTPNGSVNTDTITRRRKDETYTTISKSFPERKPVKPGTTNYDTITRTKHTGVNDTRHVVTKSIDHKETVDSSTLTRRPKDRPRSRSTSPTSIASDIEFVKSNEIVTDLDDETITSTTNRTDIRRGTIETRHTVTDDIITDKRPTSLDVTTNITTKKTKKITDRSPTSPLTDFSSPTKKSPVKDKPQDKLFKRRDTYEDRCRQILGIPTVDKNVTEVRKTTKTKVEETPRSTHRKPSTDGFPRSPSKSPEKIRSPTKDIQEFPSQIRRSPEKQPLEKVPRRTSPTKVAPKLQEFPSQIRRSPEKEPLQRPFEKCRPSREKPKVQEFPSQIRRSPEKQPLEKPLEKTRPGSYVTKVQEFPSQIRRSPEKQPLERPPEKSRPIKEGPKVQEFPSQIRRSPEKQPLEKYPEKVRPAKERPTVDEYPSQIKKVPGLGKAPGETDEPLFTKKFISTLCRDEEVERTDLRKTSTERRSPERTLPREYVTPSDTDSDRPHKTVKKDSPEKTLKEYPTQRGPNETSPERKKPSVNTKFIDTERTNTDIIVTEYEKDTRRPSQPSRVSPERRPVTERYGSDKHTTDVTEYTDEYCTTPEGYRPFKLDRKSPTRIPVSSEEKPKRPEQPDRVSPERKSVTERYDTDERKSTKYTEEYSPTDREGTRPLKPDRKSPTRSHVDSEITRRTKITEVAEYTDDGKRRPLHPDRKSPSRSPEGTRRTKTTVYTDEYGTVIPSDDDVCVPTNRRPERKSPERIRGVTEYTDEYRSTDKREKATTDRITKVTTKSTRPTAKPREPGDDEETTDSETDSTTCRVTENYIIKESTTTVPNGNIPKRTTSPAKPGVKHGITEYPAQKPKPGKQTTPQTTRVTSITTRKDRKDEKISQYNVENVRNVEVDKVHIRNHKIDDYYTNKTTKTLTNGDIPKSKTIPKRYEPKITKPGITEYPSQKSPERKKLLTERVGKPLKETPERKIPKRPDTTKIVCSPYNKPRSPDRYSPSKEITDRERTHITTVTRKTATKNISDTYESKPKAKTPTRPIQRQPEQSPSTKRHVVTTTIQVTPKTRPEGPKKPLQKTIVAHTTIEKTSRLSQPTRITERTKPSRPTQNGRATTEDDSETDYEVVDEVTDTRRVTQDTYRTTQRTDSKITRTTSDQVIKTPRRVPVRGQSKPELVTSKPTRTGENERPSTKTGKKIITTKSITINNDFDGEKEIIVNLQRSTSSREATPDRIYPRPASEDEDTGIPRYPDQISEPDEPRTRRKLTKLSDIPIIESDDSQQFTRVTEYDDTEVTRRVNKVEKTDECLLSVNQKVSKFVDVAEKLTKKPQKPLSPTRRSPRPDITVDETAQSYRTASEKLSKFVNTTEHLSTGQRIPERPKSPKCKNYPDDEVEDEHFTSVSKKVSHFIETAEKVQHPQKPTVKDGPAPKVKRPDFTDVHESIKTDDCLLSVSDKVSKFTTVHKLQSPDYKKPVSLAKIDITPKRESPTRESPRRESPRRESPLRESPRRESPRRESPRREIPRQEYPSGITTECVQIDSEEQTYIRRPSPDRYSPGGRESSPRPYTDEKTPTRSTNRQSTITKTGIQESKYVRKDSLIREPDSTPKSSRKDDEPRSVLSPTGRLRSTESIRKAKELFENIANEQRTTKQRDIISRPSVFESRKPKQPDDDRSTVRTTEKEDVKLTDIGVYNIRTSDTKSRNVSTKLRYSSDEDLETTDTTRRTISNTYNKDDHLKSTRLIMDKLHRPRSPEKDGDVPGYLRPLDRSPRPHSPYYDRSRSPKPDSDSPSRERSPRPHDPSLDEIPHYMWPLDRTLHDHSSDRDRSRSRSREPTPDIHGRIRSRASTPDGDIPGYMKPLDRHVRPSSPHRKSTNELDGIPRKHSVEDTDRTTKFGVTLRRTDSGRAVTTTTSTTTSSQRRKFSAVEIERILTTQEIEEIYDIEILEILLERAVSYEQRRRIRSQIRIVKQLIADNKLSIVTKKISKTVSPTRDSPKTRGKSPEKPMQIQRKPIDKSRTEYQTEYVRKVSPSRKTVDSKHYQHTDIVTKRSDVERKSEYQSSYAYNERRTSSEVKTHIRNSSPETKIIRGKSPEKAPRKSITNVETITRRSPERKTEKTESRSVYKTELRRATPVTKTVVEEKPSWVTLKKPSEVVSSRKTSSSRTTKKQVTSRTSPTKECKPTDVITSSYGVGPTDENGTPLFGLRALRAQNRTDKTKVQGTVIRSHYYSENGQEPTGEVSVTKYSTDPRDLDGNVQERNGLVSVTTTQKFGAKGTPSYKTIIDKKQITDLDDEECETVTRKSTTTKVSRRGSVKEMSKKFIDNAVETSKNERQSSYPKAGLILRTSSFKDTAKSGSSRESSPEKQETISRTVSVKKTSSSSSSKGQADTFLNNKTRVRGVQDVITRMKNAEDEVQAGDSAEDQEARTLLNKFIGSQVILSGMETRTSSSSSPSTTTVKRTTTTTSTTSKGGGKPTVITRTFTHPISEEEIATVWDDQTLKLLLERSTDYEERQIIRTRIREVMAEQEEKVETNKKTFTESPVTTTQVTTRVTNQQQVAKKPMSPFAKFRQLDKQNSINTPPGTPRTPTGSGALFKFTDPEVGRQVSTVKERLLQWCQMKTKEYENVQLDNFSSSWADGLAFCALIHHFLPDAFDYHALTPKERRHNFTLAFRIADEKADILPLLDVDDMVATRKPDWKCVFTYVQTIYARFRSED